ncbi:MAG: 4Fe-4S dicluster domain-containing protein [Chloroflexota bacterium]
MVPVLIITAIGLVCGALIYVGFLKIPQKVQGLEKTEEINAILPGRNCAACGFPGCFGFAQALTKNPELIRSVTCGMTAQDPEKLAKLGKALGIELDAAALAKKALVHCAGNSEAIFDYEGIETCKAAAQLLSGQKKCPYACLGLGDCVNICPEGAISIDPDTKVAKIDWNKCIGCGLCVKECPRGIIELVSPGTKIAHRCSYIPLRNIPGRERCEFGCTHCQLCFKACEAGAITWNKEKGIPEFDSAKCTLCLACVEACPTRVLTVVTREKEEAKVAAA